MPALWCPTRAWVGPRAVGGSAEHAARVTRPFQGASSRTVDSHSFPPYFPVGFHNRAAGDLRRGDERPLDGGVSGELEQGAAGAEPTAAGAAAAGKVLRIK
jgi:hypothetical protein